MNNGSDLNQQYSQMQFDSFVNEIPQQSDPFAFPQSLPPNQPPAAPPVSSQGPQSLDSVS